MKKITKPNGVIDYFYDAMGNRIVKAFTENSQTAYTWYLRDAQGNAYYIENGSIAPQPTLNTLFGISPELAELNIDFTTYSSICGFSVNFEDQYTALINWTNPSPSTSYFCLGTYTKAPETGNVDYRYGFNGKENDNDFIGKGRWQDYGMRMYRPDLGRFFSVDTATSEYSNLSTYQFSSNTPIWAIDVDGLEAWVLSRIEMNKMDFKSMLIDIHKQFLKNSNSLSVKTDCAKFQFYLMAKYFEKTGNELTFIGQENKTYSSHAKDKNGNFIYKNFDEFFTDAKKGVSTAYYYSDNDLISMKENQSEFETGDIFVRRLNGIGHSELLIIIENIYTKFYASGTDNSSLCLTCYVGSYNTSLTTIKEEGSQNKLFEWNFLKEIKEFSTVEKMTPKTIDKITTNE